MTAKKLLTTLLGILAAGPSAAADRPVYLDAGAGIEARVDDLLSRMTLTEKLGQMSQYTGAARLVELEDGSRIFAFEHKDKGSTLSAELEALIKSGRAGSFLKVPNAANANKLQRFAEASRLKIPLLIATDAIHGHGMYLDGATIFPAPLGLSATFDTDLVRDVARITAREMRATGYQWTFSPTLDVARDARWGRTGETFGEDPYLVTQMGLAMIRGYQGDQYASPDNVAATAKHFVAGSEPVNGINVSPMDVSDRTLEEVFLPPFRAAAEAGVATFMAAHHQVNGIPMHAHRDLVRGTLKSDWEYNGFVVSDWMDIEGLHDEHFVARTMDEAYRLSLEAGIDMHMHGPGYLESLEEQVKAGDIPVAYVDDAVRRILRLKFRLGLFENRYVDTAGASKGVLRPAHRRVALDAARKSIVLLKNDDRILPLSRDVKSILVTGPGADRPYQLGDWVHPQPDLNVVTVLEGIKQLVSQGTNVDYYDPGGIRSITDERIATAKRRAAEADYVVAVVGENALRSDGNERTAGENVARHDLQLPGMQPALVRALHDSGTPVIVVLINARPLATVWAADNIPAVIEAWEPGMAGGRAVAEVIFGDINPSGKLSVTIPRSVGHLQAVYNHRPAYTVNGYAFDKAEPLYPFGHGLSYTTFKYTNLKLPETIARGENLRLSVEIENSGTRDGDEVVMVFTNDVYSSVTTPVKELEAFRRITLAGGQRRRVEFVIPFEQLAFLDRDLKPVVEPGEFEVYVGGLTGRFEVVE